MSTELNIIDFFTKKVINFIRWGHEKGVIPDLYYDLCQGMIEGFGEGFIFSYIWKKVKQHKPEEIDTGAKLKIVLKGELDMDFEKLETDKDKQKLDDYMELFAKCIPQINY